MTELCPLEGITVVELGSSVAGPYCGKVLAELGAEVFKVENPAGGDTSRGWGPTLDGGASMVFEAMNKGKRSVTVDLADPAELDRLRELIATRADVFSLMGMPSRPLSCVPRNFAWSRYPSSSVREILKR